MIFQLSHQPQLSGSNFYSCFLFAFFLFVGCSASKRATDPHRNADTGLNPTIEAHGQTSKGDFTVTPGEVDTIEFEIVDETVIEPIRNPDPKVDQEGPSSESFKLNNYNISFVLPFLNNRFDRGRGTPDKKSMLAFQYYYGAKMALEKLSTEGLSINVGVHDTQASTSVTRSLLGRSDVLNSHLLIGPAKKENVEMAAEFSKVTGITMFSPFSASPNITHDNPFYVQVRPGLKSHCMTLLNDALKYHDPEDIVLVVRDKTVERKRLEIFQKAFPSTTDSVKTFKELILPNDMAMLMETDLLPYIQENDTTVFIVPSWSSENFVYSFLRQLRVMKGLNPVKVYGMPQWQGYERVSYDYYEALNLYITSEYFVNRETFGYDEFKRRFFDRYGIFPDENAFKGYDQMIYLGRSLLNGGTNWQLTNEQGSTDLNVTNFNFQPVTIEDDEGKMHIDRFENVSVSLLKFKNYRFQLVKD